MMFDDSSLVGGANSSMLNTSMKSEGGLSVLNTSRGEEVLISVIISGLNMKMVPQEAVEGADNVKEEAGEPGLAFDADSIKVTAEAAAWFEEAFSQCMHITLHKVMAETIGMGLLPEEAARELAEDYQYTL